jgi:FkbM family methyltransferase
LTADAKLTDNGRARQDEMELYNHTNPLFTKWVVAEGLLQELFVVIDVGCQGGEHPRWANLGDYLDFHGFDPIPEVIETLRRENAGRANRHFHSLALGNEDGRRLFNVQHDTFSSTFYSEPDPVAGRSGDVATGSREVEIRKLDTLHARHEIPRADHIKLDCEGFEPDILIGARQYLQASGVLSAAVETNFNISPIFPQTHFYAVQAELLAHRLLVADYSFDRAARPSYAEALVHSPWPEPEVRWQKPHFAPGAPGTHNFLFCRDFVAEKTSPHHFAPENTATPLTADRIIKTMMNFELHGLMDCAYDHAETFADLLGPRLDLEKAKKLLLAPPPELRYSPDLVKCMQMIDRLRVLLHSTEAQAPLTGRQLLKEAAARLRARLRAFGRRVLP